MPVGKGVDHNVVHQHVVAERGLQSVVLGCVRWVRDGYVYVGRIELKRAKMKSPLSSRT
jgi:hypothetical protein